MTFRASVVEFFSQARCPNCHMIHSKTLKRLYVREICQTADEVALEAAADSVDDGSSTWTPATDAGMAKIGVESPVSETGSPVIGVSPV